MTDTETAEGTRVFMELVSANWAERRFLCVGLDSDLNNKKFPQDVELHPFAQAHAEELTAEACIQLSFNCWVVDNTKHVAMAYKPNLAFYRGAMGKLVLKLTIQYVKSVAPHAVVILDAKQGDIDNTNDGYVEDDFVYFDADAVTVHNYLGMQAMAPFLNQKDKGVIVLCKTSNKGAGEFQDVTCLPWRHRETSNVYSTLAEAERETGASVTAQEYKQVAMPHYLFVALRIKQAWNRNGNCMVVVGATWDEDLAKVREVLGDGFGILLPGIGAQGAEVKPTVDAGKDANGEGMVINSSRGIIFASPFDEEAGVTPVLVVDAVRKAAEETNDQIIAALAA